MAIEWLSYEQSKMPEGVEIMHFYKGGEKRILFEKSFLYIDGYAKSDNETWIFEFLGCNYHHCPKCKTNLDKKQANDRRRDFLCQQATHYIEIKECEWYKLKQNQKIPPAEIFKWRNKSFTSNQLLDLIQNDEFFGLCQVAIDFPEESREKWRNINFPPIFDRISLNEEQISADIKKLLHSKKTKFPLPPQLMLTFSVKEYICPTTMIQFYLKEGANIKIDWAIAYSKGLPLRDFIQGQTDSRIEADRAGKKMKSKLHKDIR